MQIDATARSVRLSVRELATFRQAPVESGAASGAWRAAVGREWHKTEEDGAREAEPGARFEVPVRAKWRHRDWIFDLQGRIDQIVPDGAGVRLREVKTVRHPLPADPGELADTYADHFAQAAIYLTLVGLLPEFADRTASAELLFIDIDSGARQRVPLADVDPPSFQSRIDALLPFLEDRRACRLRLANCEIRPAFENLRPGQAELFRTLDEARNRARTVLLEAPTGFGKTGLALEHALRSMRDGLYERCLYLTCKSTGQIELVRQLRAMIGDNVRYIQMRNRAEHRIESDAHTCTGDTACDTGLAEKWAAADVHPPDLFREGTLSLERARDIGARTGVCPYALTKGCLPFAEVWIGDANYAFGPASRNVFLGQPGFAPERTLLIVDEAHNLPDRAADALGVEIAAGDLRFAVAEIRSAGATRRLENTGMELARFIEALPKQRPLEPNALYEAADLAEELARHLEQLRIDFGDVPESALATMRAIPLLARRLADAGDAWLHWTPEAGVLRGTCLDPAPWIAECLAPFGGAILMSATLAPTDLFRRQCGLLPEHTGIAPGHAAWREGAYTVAVDARADTRFKRRARFHETTAGTVAAFAAAHPGEPTAVFFPSYQYADDIRKYLEILEPGLRVLRQPRGVDLAQQDAFIDEALLLADVLFLVLGSGYAEGIDKLGGRVRSVMIVGPALPEVNAVREAQMRAHSASTREAAFRDVFIVPAMRRVHQALGRLVRAPGHRARVLLHGRRYADPDYHDALMPEYRPGTTIRSDAELCAWLGKSD